MDLFSYLKEKNLSQEAFSRSIKANQSTISCWRTGQRLPSLRLALKIERVTKGEVTPESFLELAERKRPRKRGART